MNDTLYNAVIRVLKAADKALTCHEVSDDAEVRSLSNASVSLVSNYLGNLWRQGLVKRVPAVHAGTGPNKARYAYEWPREVAGVHIASADLYDSPTVKIARSGKSITITMPHLSIVIEQT